jgi:hypothetical protein
MLSNNFAEIALGDWQPRVTFCLVNLGRFSVNPARGRQITGPSKLQHQPKGNQAVLVIETLGKTPLVPTFRTIFYEYLIITRKKLKLFNIFVWGNPGRGV